MRENTIPLNQTITIKAGERAANVRIRGNYDAIAATDSLGLTLRLLTQQADQWDLYEKSYEAKVILQKCCPFDINLFNGYAVLTSTYMQEFMPNVDNRRNHRLRRARPSMPLPSDQGNHRPRRRKHHYHEGLLLRRL